MSAARRDSAFTLLELLGVLAIMVILAAILIPTTTAVRQSALKARTRVQLSQWAAAIELFREEYGAYPVLPVAGRVNSGAGPALAAVHPFHDLLSGRRRDGSALPEPPGVAVDGVPPPEAQNVRRVAFVRFAAADFWGDDAPTPAEVGLLRDALGNTDIAVLVDRNQDGWINAADYAVWPAVSPVRSGGPALVPAGLTGAGVRAGVLLYCAPPGATEPGQLLTNLP
jgi:prepilin-type N-terminal cleavage/methylation domain-containing protein